MFQTLLLYTKKNPNNKYELNGNKNIMLKIPQVYFSGKKNTKYT